MFCKICNNKFYIKRTFLSLFDTKEYYICNKCYEKYKINLKSETFMLENYNCTVLSMFDKDYKINYDAFIFEYSMIFEHLIRVKKHKILFLDSIDIDMSLDMLNIIANLYKTNIIIFVFYIKNVM